MENYDFENIQDIFKDKIAPLQVEPGIRSNSYLKASENGVPYQKDVFYDEYGRLEGITDWGDHGRALEHPIPHNHQFKPSTGQKLVNPDSGTRVWPGEYERK